MTPLEKLLELANAAPEVFFEEDDKESIAFYRAFNPRTAKILIEIIQMQQKTLKDVLEFIDTGERDSIRAPEDDMVENICQGIGYGAVIDSAARLWRRKDPVAAFTSGPCVYVVKNAKEALKQVEIKLGEI